MSLSAATLLGVRLAGHSMIFVNYVLNRSLANATQVALEHLQGDLAAVRDAGLKAVVRFCYTLSISSDFTPPYSDAPQLPVLQMHIVQLSDVLNSNVDVVLALQAGFVGVWGEWYYSDLYSAAGVTGAALTSALARRDAVLLSLLQQVSGQLQVAVRTPAIAEQFVAATNTSGVERARLSQHNDCFLASPTDMGTYANYDEETYHLAQAEGKIVGGETCAVDANRINCDVAIDELARLHFSYLNADYNLDVLARWTAAGCMDAIAANLGYNLHLRSPHALNLGGGRFAFSTLLENTGFAPPLGANFSMQLVTTLPGNDQLCVANVPRHLYSSPSRWLGNGRMHRVGACEYNSPDPAAQRLYLVLSDDSSPRRVEYRLMLLGSTWNSTHGFNELNVTDSPAAPENSSDW